MCHYRQPWFVRVGCLTGGIAVHRYYDGIICHASLPRLIRLSSPNLNYLIGGGAIILYIDMYFFIIPTADPNAVVVLCNVRIGIS